MTFVTLYYAPMIINRPGVAGAVLQTPLGEKHFVKLSGPYLLRFWSDGVLKIFK